MPWDDSMLYVAQLATDGSLSSTRKVSYGKICSLRQVPRVSGTAICAVLARSAVGWQQYWHLFWQAAYAVALCLYVHHNLAPGPQSDQSWNSDLTHE